MNDWIKKEKPGHSPRLFIKKTYEQSGKKYKPNGLLPAKKSCSNKKAYRRRQKIFTTNNHYERSKLPVAPVMPCLELSPTGLIYIIMQIPVVTQQIIVII
jgi:hypothetical protein